ncbi:alpha/beta hydrolase [soil metagenome]
MVTAALIVLVLGYAGVCAFMYAYQRSLQYFPQPARLQDSAKIMRMLTTDGHTVVSTRPHDGPKAVIYLGGNGEDVTESIADLDRTFPDSALYLLQYRGYGASDGKPSQDVLFADALELFDKVSMDHGSVTLIGRSLGSGVATYVASRRPVARLVLVTPYDSIQTIAAKRYPWLPVSLLLKDKFESFKYAPEVKAPTLVIAAEGDATIPLSSTERLLGFFRPGIASYRLLRGVGHNTVQQDADYFPLLSGTTR